MSQSLVKNYIHIIYSTKNREPWLVDKKNLTNLCNYSAGILQNKKCMPLAIGGHDDHLHILCNLSKNIALSKLLEVVKTNSSRWIKEQNPKYEYFAWQNGYGGFSVHENQTKNIASYINNQDEVHKSKSFEEEYLEILKEHKMKYDPKYLF